MIKGLSPCPHSLETLLSLVYTRFMAEKCIQNEEFMREALREAQTAFDLGEVPVGCVIVRDGEIIARGHNLTETAKDPTVHAEMNALREKSFIAVAFI